MWFLIEVFIFCGIILSKVYALSLDISDVDSICNAASTIANGEWSYYEGLKYGGTVGIFLPPYYWWNGGEAFGGLLDYYTYCEPNNDTLRDIIYDGIYHQAGSNMNFMPSNQSQTEGNDDQGVWALALINAAELQFKDPPHTWISMTETIFDLLLSRWDTSTCGGGIRWEYKSSITGYDYKNTISNGYIFHLGARLARFTGNDTYMQISSMVWDWMADVGFIVEKENEIVIYDGAHVELNCTDITSTSWSYIYGIILSGAAFAYNVTEEEIWLNRTNSLIEGSKFFLNNSIITETSCATGMKCNTDQRSFRSLFSRGLGLTTLMVPSTYNTIKPWLEASASGIARSCSGGDDGVTCGFNWSYDGWDGWYGLGEQLCALETILALRARDFPLSRN